MTKSLVIIPTYNEIENIRDIVNEVILLETYFHVLVVDDSSPDGTASEVKKLQEDWPERLHLLEREGKHGLGTAYIAGFHFALDNGYDLIFEMDADFSHNPKDLLSLKAACEGGMDMVIGSRYITGVNVVNWPMGRVLMSYFASWYVRLVTGMPFRDATAGFKCYKRRVLETIDMDHIKFIGYAFQIEMKFLTWKHGFEIKEVPIVFTDRTRGQSKMSSGIFKEAIIGVIQMKIRSWFRKYEPAA
ncbi:MAG: polyprenol monophosphomannose synthase [Cytophagales bacterium]|nr:polyprenol monophosphomannose synthase [Cytophagales bacterium]